MIPAATVSRWVSELEDMIRAIERRPVGLLALRRQVSNP
jgi:hypothetical protein